MSVLDSARPTDAAIDSLTSTFSSANRDEIDGANTPPQRIASNYPTAEGALRDAPKRDDRQVLPAAAMLDDQLHDGARSPSHERVWLRAWRPARPNVRPRR